MLVLSRKTGEIIIIGEFGEIKILLLEINNKTAKIGIIAPKKIPVHREEVYEKILAAAKELQIQPEKDQTKNKRK
jgi:carbon storage regulator